MGLIKTAQEVFREEGLSTLIIETINYIYRNLPFSPYRDANYNGVKVPMKRVINLHRPDYEKELVDSVNKNVREGDKVVVLGGGYGVTSVKAAHLSGNSSNIHVFEASKQQVEKIEKTFCENDVEEINLHHAIVGPKVNVWGSSEEAKKISPDEIPDCDVLEMDVEGSEIEILKNLDIRPRVIIVEYHGVYDAPTEKVKSILKDMPYRIKDVEMINVDSAKGKDIKIVTAILKDD